MAKKTPRKKRKPYTLDAISGTDAIEVLRILANRDKELSKEIDVIAKDLLADVSLDEVADCVQAELESLAVEDVWDRSGARRDGYVDTGETAWQMFEAALQPFVLGRKPKSLTNPAPPSGNARNSMGSQPAEALGRPVAIGRGRECPMNTKFHESLFR